MSQIHTTVGVYPSWKSLGAKGYKINGVSPQDLESHIDFNLKFRPGRALFVDGVCKNPGFLSAEEIFDWEERLQTDPKFKAIAHSKAYV